MFDAKPIYLAARFVCQFWDHQKLFSLPANTSSSQPSTNPGSNSLTSGNSSSNLPNPTDAKTSDQSD